MEEDTSQTLTKHRSPLSRATSTNHRGSKNRRREDDDDDHADEEQCDAQVRETLSKSFRDVQSVLDQNRVLIKQVNDNHRSKLHDNIVQNVDLIREINGNISKVMGIYSDLAVNFSSIVQDRRSAVPKNETAATATALAIVSQMRLPYRRVDRNSGNSTELSVISDDSFFIFRG